MTQLTDADLVEAAQGGDREALAQLYERYFDAVYDFAARMVRNRDEAADIAQETFLKAMNALGGLKQGASFRSWLFSIARNTALNRLERRGRTRPLAVIDAEGEEFAFDVVDPSRFASPQEAAEAAAAAKLVWEAAAGLDPRQLSLLDLHLRQGLDAEEIAAALGITRNNAYVLLHRLKKAVESAISAYVLWKQAGERCEELAAVLAPAAAAGAMTPAVRKAVDRHVERCGECRERRRRLAPLAVFGGLAPVAAPPGVRAAGLEQLLRAPGPRPQPRPADPAARQAPPQGGHGFTSPGFLRAGALLGVAAGVLLLALVLPFSPLALTRDDGSGARQGSPDFATPAAGGGSQTIIVPVSPSPGTAAGGGSPSPSAGGAGSSPTAGASPSPGGGPGGASPTAAPAGGSTPAPTPTAAGASPTPTAPGATATATPTAAPSATPTPCAPSLSLPPGTGTLVIPAGGQASFQLQNATGCAAEYSLAPSAAWLIGPAGGSIPAYGSVTITLRVDGSALPADEGDYPAAVTVTGPANSFAVPVIGRRGGQPPQFLSASMTCGTAGGAPSVTLTAQVADDIGVVRVTATFTAGGETVTVDLGHAGGLQWGAGLALDGQGAGPVTFTAYDGAGRQATLAVAPAGCGGGGR